MIWLFGLERFATDNRDDQWAEAIVTLLKVVRQRVNGGLVGQFQGASQRVGQQPLDDGRGELVLALKSGNFGTPDFFEVATDMIQ